MRTKNSRLLFTNILLVHMFPGVKEPTQYSKRVRDEVPGVVSVLFSPVEVAGLAWFLFKKACGVAETALSQKGLCEHVDVDHVDVMPAFSIGISIIFVN